MIICDIIWPYKNLHTIIDDRIESYKILSDIIYDHI